MLVWLVSMLRSELTDCRYKDTYKTLWANGGSLVKPKVSYDEEIWKTYSRVQRRLLRHTDFSVDIRYIWWATLISVLLHTLRALWLIQLLFAHTDPNIA
jgi:hypothetical protein